MSRSAKIRWLSALIIIGAMIALFHSSFSFEIFSVDRMIRLVRMARANAWVTAGFYGVYVVGVMALPITMFPIMGGILLPFWAALPLNVAAATAGAWFSRALSRYFGRARIEPYLRSKIKSWDELTATQGFKTVVVLRLVGVPPFIISNYALGFSEISHFDFILGTALGILPWMIIVTYFSHSLWDAVLVGGKKGLARALFETVRPLMMVSAILITTVLVNLYIKRRRHSNL